MLFKMGDRVRFHSSKSVIDPRNGEECVVQYPESTTSATTVAIEFNDGTIGLAHESELTLITQAEAWIQVTFEKGHVLNSKITTAAELVEKSESVAAAKELWENTISMIKDLGALKTLTFVLRDGSQIGINPRQVTYASVVGGEKILDELERMINE